MAERDIEGRGSREEGAEERERDEGKGLAPKPQK